jgi:tetratricopeptide (TPR) repeat protein
LFKRGDYEKAVKHYRKILSVYKDYPEADHCAFRIAQSLYLGKNFRKAIIGFSEFLEGFPESGLFDEAFLALSRLYFEDPSPEKAVGRLQYLVKAHSERSARNYARLLTGFLYYTNEDYDNALTELVGIRDGEDGSPYFYAADTLIKDIEKIKKGRKPAFGHRKSHVYRIWESDKAIQAEIEPGEARVKPGSIIEFTLTNLKDADKFTEYLEDADDESRLPKKITEGAAGDLLAIQWAAAGGGEFADGKQTPAKSWQAPETPGRYTVSARVEDLALTRPPDKGSRKDAAAKELSSEITVE